ncbi:DNA/RNA non-specific endonuclease [uncultured Pedobacter sp.]|uniref:DNA/RNA non-specific endonuclease n=1 Tax=uncultured Pedobacter sp. TaxID=246139 RepID=UPI0025CDACC2|nr:DNA/RNA non-specific endonuclease [uncultured Pedobacter sp.]
MSTSIPGYNPTFLGKKIDLPILDLSDCAPLLNGTGMDTVADKEIKYTHFSIFQHKVRKLPILAAVNISGEAYNASTRTGGDDWNYCNQIDKSYQLGGTFYGNDLKTFDRGHIIRRVDPCWGDKETCERADAETFNWANCTPQHKLLNQKKGIWYELEQHVIENGVKDKKADVSVFAGPVLNKKDLNFIKPYRESPIQIPSAFWKIIVYKKTDGKTYAVGFMMSQWQFIKDRMINGPVLEKARINLKDTLPDDYFENLKFSDNKVYQVKIDEIELATGIRFNWKGVGRPFQQPQPLAIIAKAVNKKTILPDVGNGEPVSDLTIKSVVPKNPFDKSAIISGDILYNQNTSIKKLVLKNIIL